MTDVYHDRGIFRDMIICGLGCNAGELGDVPEDLENLINL